MQTPTHRPLLPTSHLRESLPPVIFSAKSLFCDTLPASLLFVIFCADFNRNLLKIKMTGGRGGVPPLAPRTMQFHGCPHPCRPLLATGWDRCGHFSFATHPAPAHPPP